MYYIKCFVFNRIFNMGGIDIHVESHLFLRVHGLHTTKTHIHVYFVLL